MSFLFFSWIFPKQPTPLSVRAINIGKINVIKHKYIALLHFKRKVGTNPNEYVPRKDCNSPCKKKQSNNEKRNKKEKEKKEREKENLQPSGLESPESDSTGASTSPWQKRHTSSTPSEYVRQILHLREASELFFVCRSATCMSSSLASLKAVPQVSQSLVEFLCLARLWAFIAFDFFRFEWQARWWQKWILRFLGWFLLSRFFTIVASLLSLVVLSLAFLYFRLCLSRVCLVSQCVYIKMAVFIINSWL